MMGQRLDNAKALYLEGIRDGNAAEAIEKYAGQRYTQHSTPVKDGKAGFLEFFEDFLVRNPIRDIEIVRGFEDGRYVFLHAVQTLNDGEFRYVTADIFDTDDDGKMIEHWDMIAELADDTSSDGIGSGRSQVDGPTKPTDLHRTEFNKMLVRRFMKDVLKNGELDKLDHYVCAKTFIDHNPENLVEHVQSMRYDEIHNVIGSGEFVATLSKMNLSGVDIAVIDLFRVADGRIVEHWDVREEITPEDTWVNSGKF